MTRQTFLQGTIILVAAGLVTKLLGFFNRIVLSRIIGSEGMGLYQMAVPTLYLIITLSTFGLPIAISKLVAEAEAQHNRRKIRNILRISLGIVTVLSIIFTSAMILGAPLISEYLLTDERAFYSLISIAPIVPIVAISSILRGYFQGLQNMIPTATSQIMEQTVRIFTVFTFTQLLLPYGIEFAAAGAMIGIVIGEFTGMCVLLYKFRKVRVKKIFKRSKTVRTIMKGSETLRDLFRIAVPVTASRLIGSITFALEPIVVARSLAIAGISTVVATSQYGELAGMAIPLLTFPTFFTYSLSVSLVPAISEGAAKKNYRMVQRRIYQSLRISLVVGAPFSVLMFVFAEPICLAVYGNPDVGSTMKVMAPLFFFLYFQGPLAAILQGLDHAQAAMRNSVIGAIVKTIMIFVLASRPELGINGVAMAINIGVVLVTLLHFFSIIKLVGFSIQGGDFVKVGIIVVLMGYLGVLTYNYVLNTYDFYAIALLVGLMASVSLYFIMLLSLRVIGQQDISRIPWIGPYIAPLFPKR
ncbi:MAG: stage V sporulation protein B [Bacillaceae bacterium]|nr:stage V sporulation protein B [Bacillaceae bacterium]